MIAPSFYEADFPLLMTCKSSYFDDIPLFISRKLVYQSEIQTGYGYYAWLKQRRSLIKGVKSI